MKIFGTIKDEFDNPIEGVHVRMKLFNSVGDFTDRNGAFVKDSPAIKETDEILITHVGYEPISFLAKDLVGKKVTMIESLNELNEITVTNSPETSNQASIVPFLGSNTQTTPLSKDKKKKLFLAIAGGVALMTIGFIIIKKNI